MWLTTCFHYFRNVPVDGGPARSGVIFLLLPHRIRIFPRDVSPGVQWSTLSDGGTVSGYHGSSWICRLTLHGMSVEDRFLSKYRKNIRTFRLCFTIQSHLLVTDAQGLTNRFSNDLLNLDFSLFIIKL